MTGRTPTMGIPFAPIIMVIAGIIFVAIPVIYFGELDGATAVILLFGIGLLFWAVFRAIWLRKNRSRRFN